MTFSRAEGCEYAASILLGVSLIWLIQVNLLPALLAGLLIFSLINALIPVLRISALGRGGPRLLALVLVAGILTALVSLAVLSLLSVLRSSHETLPALFQRMAEIIEHSRARLPSWVSENLPADTDDLRSVVVDMLRRHADMFQTAGAGLGRALAQVLIGFVIGALLSLESADMSDSRGPLTSAFARRAVRLGLAFRRVFFAQFWISGINTIFSSVYLLIILPAAGIHLPFTNTLILITFLAGMIPILGNLISNAIIVTVSLSQSLGVAFSALGFLVLIHKLEYFLNARIIGSHIRARAWELLMAMLILESACGVPGLVAAPLYYAYLKDELGDNGLI